jgi:RNA polymerase sigma-70 factor (ECF subfamily)
VGKPDSTLITACALGDRGALRELYRRYSRAVFSWSLRVLRSPEAAESATERVFIEAWKGAGRKDPSISVRSWLFALAQTVTGDVAPDPDLDAIWLGGQAASHLAALPLHQAEALRLVGHEHRSMEEAARILGVSEAQARREVFAGLASLKQALEEHRVSPP